MGGLKFSGTSEAKGGGLNADAAYSEYISIHYSYTSTSQLILIVVPFPWTLKLL